MLRMMMAVVALLLGACSSVATKPASLSVDSLIAAETAFAKSMADRDFDAFASHVDEGAVFINGGKPLRGKAAVLAHWKKFFESSEAPFAWKPEIAEVSASWICDRSDATRLDSSPTRRWAKNPTGRRSNRA